MSGTSMVQVGEQSQQQRLDELNGEGLEVAPNATPLQFLEAVFRNSKQPMQRRVKAAIEAAQYVHAKLAVTATVNGGDFAAQLDRAVEQSNRVMKTIDHQPTQPSPSVTALSSSDTKPPSNGHKPSVPDRRYRRW